MIKEFKMLPLDGKKSIENHVILINFVKQKIFLKSYKTIVASYDIIHDKMVVTDYYSRTTMRHLNNFLVYFDYPTVSKKQLLDFVKNNSGIIPR